jgi:hypothetical protein
MSLENRIKSSVLTLAFLITPIFLRPFCISVKAVINNQSEQLLTKKGIDRGEWRYLTEQEVIRLKYFVK